MWLPSALPCWAKGTGILAPVRSRFSLQCSLQWSISTVFALSDRDNGWASFPSPLASGNRRAQRCPPVIRSLCSFLIDALTNSGELWNLILSLLTPRLDPPRQHLFNPRANFSLIWGKPVCTLPNSGTDGDGALLLLQSHQMYQFLPNCCESKMKNSKLLLFLSLFLGIGTGMIYELQCATLWSKYL